MVPKNHPSNGSPASHQSHGREEDALSAAPTGRKKIAQGKEHSDAALGHESQNTSSPEGAKEITRLPAGWALKTIGELGAKEPNSITDGPFGSKLKTEHYTRSGPRVIRLTNIGDGEFVDAHAHISDGHFSTLQKHRIFSGDIVIRRYRDSGAGRKAASRLPDSRNGWPGDCEGGLHPVPTE
jgi:hypothetical protein